MRIDDNYTIESDKYCWVLRYKKEGEFNEATGKRKLSMDETYHPTVKAALKKYMDAKLKGSGAISELIERLENIEQLINNINNK